MKGEVLLAKADLSAIRQSTKRSGWTSPIPCRCTTRVSLIQMNQFEAHNAQKLEVLYVDPTYMVA